MLPSTIKTEVKLTTGGGPLRTHLDRAAALCRAAGDEQLARAVESSIEAQG